MNAVEFLAELWGPSPDGWVQIWELETKRSTFWRSPSAVVGFDDRTEIFTGVALAGEQLPRTQRAKLGQIVGIAGMWLDIDLPSGPAQQLARAYLEPTILVHSGHGLHAWYLFDGGPWRFQRLADKDEAVTMAAQFQALHRMVEPTLDATQDLTRVLRLPGTRNAKGDSPVPVEVIDADGPRHDLDELRELRELCATADVLQAAAPSGLGGHACVQLDAGRLQDVDADWLEQVLESDVNLAVTFFHPQAHSDKPGFSRSADVIAQHPPERRWWTMSHFDLSLAAQAAEELDDDKLAQLIVAHRRHHDPGDPKATRVDYLARTIARARTARTAPIARAA